MRFNLIGVIVAVASLFVLSTITAMAGNGPSKINIYGGSEGKVPFPHAQHQKQTKDCNVCHKVFPQKTDAIKKMKEAGKLKAKKVMNLQCIKCHKAEKRAGNPYGPVTCKTCHKK
jgi:hypothetical protein